MIDPIGVKPGMGPDRPVAPEGETRIARIAAARPVGTVAETEARAAAKAMAARPPVDAERVEQIKKALQEGRFPIVPSLIADRLIAAELSWAERK